MSSPANPRKRPAPGSAPVPPQMQQQTFNADQLMRWNGNNAGNYLENSTNNMNPYMMNNTTQPQFSQGIATPSTALATRRGMGNALVPANRSFSPQTEAWPDFGDGSLIPNPGTNGVDEHDNIELLEEKAQRAKRDASAKRKQIPPFVQKLNSFLEESKNTELIRWSEKGDSFIVLDEDEFAKTLIPELFKHNNYASFVRQLNMYGFHKKVGLSDNSMKASERKNKSPSEYYNPYFRRGHPNLLWLINKPKSGNAGKKDKSKTMREDGAESDDEINATVDDGLAQTFTQQGPANRALPAPGPESGPLQRKELAVVRDQMTALQNQQKTISQAITRLRHDHNTLFQQAMAFQTQHDRHENSINAILNFLANVFQKSLDEEGGVQGFRDLINGVLPNVRMPGGQGSVVDLGEWPQQQGGSSNAGSQVHGTPRRAQRLLPPPPNVTRARSMPRSAYAASPSQQTPELGSVTELFDTPIDQSKSPTYPKQELESTPQESMMKIINDTNANNAGKTPVNLPDVVTNTSTSWTDDQRDRVLSILSNANNNGGAGSNGNTPTPSSRPADVGGTESVPPANSNKSSMSLSPNMPPNPIPPPNLQHMRQNAEDIEQLQRLQHEQNQKLDNLSNLLGPLSPSGRIPGLDDPNASSYFGNDDIDLNQYLDSSAFTTGDGTGTGPDGFNFDPAAGFDDTSYDWNAGAGTNIDFGVTAPPTATTPSGGGGGGGGGGLDPGISNRVVETTTPSQNSPSPSGTEEILRDDLDNSPGRAAKRHKPR